jgi:hypothetical protein
LRSQFAQINLIAQCRAESGQQLFRIILLPVEAAINDGLNALAQRLE